MVVCVKGACVCVDARTRRAMGNSLSLTLPLPKCWRGAVRPLTSKEKREKTREICRSGEDKWTFSGRDDFIMMIMQAACRGRRGMRPFFGRLAAYPSVT